MSGWCQDRKAIAISDCFRGFRTEKQPARRKDGTLLPLERLRSLRDAEACSVVYEALMKPVINEHL